MSRDLDSGLMRELFMTVQANGQPEGVWTGADGWSIASPGLKNLAKENYGLQQTQGISNVAGMHNALGFIGIVEALMGEINHALCFTAASLRMTNDDGTDRVSWPARASDGKLEIFMPGGSFYGKSPWNGPTITPTHGQWGRLAADVDPMWNPETGNPYAPFTRLLIRAAKKYGLVATDTNLWCHAFNAEQGRTWKHFYGEDPWAEFGLIDKIYRNPDGTGGVTANEFSWHRTEWAPVGWGRPSLDTNLRPGQLMPWTKEAV